MVFSDVQKNGWIQPYKPIYTMRDFNRLCKEHDALTVRFILVCSSAYYERGEKRECGFSKPLEKKFRDIMNFRNL